MSPSRRALLYIEDAIEHARYAIEFCDGKTFQDFEEDRLLQFAVVRAIEVVGEATKSISEEIKGLAPNVPWREIAITRNKIVHHYFGVRLNLLWNVVQIDALPHRFARRAIVQGGDA